MSTKNASPHLKRQQQRNRNNRKKARLHSKLKGGVFPKPGVRPISILSRDHPMRAARSEEEWRDALMNRDRSKWL